MSHPSISRSNAIYTIAIIGFIYTLHLVIPYYSNSSFLSLFVNEQTLGFIYMAGAAVSILGFLVAPALIRRFGNYHMALTFVAIQMAIFYGLVVSNDAYVISFLFIAQRPLTVLGLVLGLVRLFHRQKTTLHLLIQPP